jgi:serine/threonine protein phosphatase PrpC
MIDLQSFYAKTYQGPFLNLNEDDVFVDLENKIFAVFDGFGGTNIGDKAVDLVKDNLKNFFNHVSSDPDATMPYFYDAKYLIETNVLMNSVYLAHERLLKDNQPREMAERGGVSGLVGILSENILCTVSVGNCAAFLYRNGSVSLLASPDCSVPVGAYGQDSYLRTFPLSAMGLYDELSPKIWEHNIHPGDVLVFTTDGAYANIDLSDIKRVVETSADEHYMIKSLFDISNHRGNLDNQSAIVLSF